jgi:hypothetical protein
MQPTYLANMIGNAEWKSRYKLRPVIVMREKTRGSDAL